MNTLALGDKVRDTISGFKGTVTAITRYLHGEDRVCVEPSGLHDGKPIEPQWFDSARLEKAS